MWLQAAGGMKDHPLGRTWPPGAEYRCLAGLLRGAEVTFPSPGLKGISKGGSCLELPKSWAPLGTKPWFPQVILSPGSATDWAAGQPRSPGAQGRRSFLRSLCPAWDPRWAAFTRPLNCPCSFPFFLQGQGQKGHISLRTGGPPSQNVKRWLPPPPQE